MFLLRWSGGDLFWMVVGAALIVSSVVLAVPARKLQQRSFTDEEIASYDDHVPRYFIFAAVALVVGGIHMVVKNVPGFATWLWEAGYGGHLFRDLSNSHIIIVGGGTVMLTGLTWYFLPRVLGRPLYSHGLATASLWFTVIGVFGFYLAWLVLGLVEGGMVRDGMTYDAAKELVGKWHSVPTRLTSGIMGIGYWTYVLEVALTTWAARRQRTSQGWMAKFLVVPAAALFVGTVQGVLQVLPEAADWIHDAGAFGQYVDPISHAHINLVTGMVVALAGFLVVTIGSRDPNPARSTRATFWWLTGGSMAFYLVFLFTGLILGAEAVGHGILVAPGVADWLRPRSVILIAVAGSAMLIGFWVYFAFVLRHLPGRSRWAKSVRGGVPAGFWLVSIAALAVGTLQGLGQVIPATARYLTVAEELPNVHAQLNMIGGVLLALMATGMVVLPKILGQPFPTRPARIALFGIGGGMFGLYASTLWEGAARGAHLLDGLSDGEAAAAIGSWPQVAMTIASAVVLAGFFSFGRGIWAMTGSYRRAWADDRRSREGRIAGAMPERLRRTPVPVVLAMEFVGGLFGWPGVGWLYSSRPLEGVTLILVGPSIAWALMPMLFSPYTDTFLTPYGWQSLLVWLPISAALSTGFLAFRLWRMRSAHRSHVDSLANPDEPFPVLVHR